MKKQVRLFFSNINDKPTRTVLYIIAYIALLGHRNACLGVWSERMQRLQLYIVQCEYTSRFIISVTRIFFYMKTFEILLFIVQLWSLLVFKLTLKELAEKSYSTLNFDFFCWHFWWVRRQAMTTGSHAPFCQNKQKCQKKNVKIKSWITFFSKFFQRNG